MTLTSLKGATMYALGQVSPDQARGEQPRVFFVPKLHQSKPWGLAGGRAPGPSPTSLRDRPSVEAGLGPAR